MLVAAAVLPHPPVLVPEVASGAAAELEPIRRACDQAVATVVSAAPGLVVVVGWGPVSQEHPTGAVGSLRGFGVEVDVVLGAGGAEKAAVLPLSLTIGCWLLARSGWAGDTVGLSVSDETSAEEAAALGAGLAARAERVGLLVMGDGSARLSPAAPGYVDPDAGSFQAVVVEALSAGDREGLLSLDPARATALMAAGRAPWQVLAGAAAASGGQVRAHLLAHDAPYGVDYLVATWVPGSDG